MMRTTTLPACLAITISLFSSAVADAAPAANERSPSRDSVRPSRTGPVSLILAGGVVTLGGAVLIALDEDSYTAPAGQYQRESYWDTMPAGIAAVGAGLVITGLGAYWFGKRAAPTASDASTTARMPRSTSTWAGGFPSARVTSTGVSFGWTGTF